MTAIAFSTLISLLLFLKQTSGFLATTPSSYVVIPDTCSSWKDKHHQQMISPPATTASSTNKTCLSSVSQQSILWVTATVVGGALGAPFVTKPTKTWYRTISLPSYTPPNAIFGPVWSLLYTSMGIASWRIRTMVSSLQLRNLGIIQKNIMLLSFVHYALNIIWAPVFFGMQRLRLGHILNIVIWASLLPVLIGYSTIDLLSGMLLIPYFLWLSFAIKLSDGICKLNPTQTKNGTRLFNNARLESEIWDLREEAGKKVGL
mmetsp:Transcript_23442/g.34865  ORF Transcript_23442/g.34865 Transcript_23442/m.34865 type:complete len:260 (+) Transcript_23442:3-782(+)